MIQRDEMVMGVRLYRRLVTRDDDEDAVAALKEAAIFEGAMAPINFFCAT